MTVIPMQQSHIAAVAALEQTCFSEPWSAAALAEELTNPHAVFRVAVEGDTLLGYVGMHHLVDEGFVTNVAVSPAARRRGVARALLAELAAYGRENALYRITLEVRVGNTHAVRVGGVHPGRRAPRFLPRPHRGRGDLFAVFLRVA